MHEDEPEMEVRVLYQTLMRRRRVTNRGDCGFWVTTWVSCMFKWLHKSSIYSLQCDGCQMKIFWKRSGRNPRKQNPAYQSHTVVKWLKT
ncbi:hypothetical protein HN873_059279 [Arachis hypogaea]